MMSATLISSPIRRWLCNRNMEVLLVNTKRHLMDETEKKSRMNTEGESVNRNHEKRNTIATDNGPPKELNTLLSSDVTDITTSDFKVVKTKHTFVDKSEGIKRLFQIRGSGVQITAPRRFGKSTFMNMVKEFLMIPMDKDGNPIEPEKSENYEMFMKLKLGQKHGDFVKKHCGQYPVISMSLKSVGGRTTTDVLNSLKTTIYKTFKKHFYLLETAPDGSKSFKNKTIEDVEKFLTYSKRVMLKELSEDDVIDALYFLSEILYTHFNKKVVILVDEADAPIVKGITDNMDAETLKELMRILRRMLSEGLKDNEFMELSLISSCVRLSGVYSFDLNNQYRAWFLQTKPFCETYGFTEQEVRNLLENAAFQALNDFDGIKKWYNGYQTLNEDGPRIYNSWCVINYLSNSIEEGKKMFGTYWAESGLLDILKKLLVNHELQERIDQLMTDESVSIKVALPTVDNILELKNAISCPQHQLKHEQVDFFLQLLWDVGLLNAIEKIKEDTVELKIPNFEIKEKIKNECYTQSLFEARYKLKPKNIERYVKALKRLLLTSSEEEENNEEEGEIEESEERTTDKWEKAMQNLVDAVSRLFSDDSVIPEDESEFHDILFYLAYNNQLLKTQSSRAVVVKVSEELRDCDKLKKVDPHQAKTSPQSKGNEKRGRKNECDMCVTCGTGGLIFELKLLKNDTVNENSRAALQQIIDRNYYKLFDKEEFKHVKTKIYVRLCFKNDAHVSARYLVNSIDINKSKIVYGRKCIFSFI